MKESDPIGRFLGYHTDTGVAADLAASQTRIETINSKPFSVRPDRAPELIAEALTPPKYVSQCVSVATLAALLEFIEFHATAKVPVFANQASRSFTAIFDYHANRDKPDHTKNRAIFALEYDPRFKAWDRYFGQWITQEQLVDLIEDNAPAMITPTSAIMLELAENLEIHRSEKVVNKRSRHSGAGVLTFESSEGESTTKLPENLTIGVPIYKGLRTKEGKLKAWQIQLRLRYRVKDGQVVFHLKPANLDEILEDLWESLVLEVRGWELLQVIEGVAP